MGRAMRQTRIGMIAVGLAFWVAVLFVPGYQLPILVLSGALATWAVFGLLTEE